MVRERGEVIMLLIKNVTDVTIYCSFLGTSECQPQCPLGVQKKTYSRRGT